jgi:hypothetical protein
MGRFQAVTRGSNWPELPLKSTENKSVLFSYELIRRGYPAKENRSEFVCLAVEEKLERGVVRPQNHFSAVP